MIEGLRNEVETAAARRPQIKSQQLYRRAREIILGGTQTLSKQPERFDAERFPAYIDHGRGCRLWDLDGNEFIDFVMALGPVVLGYCYGAVDDAVRRQLSRGVIFSGNSPLEVELAERLVQIIPNAERVRFFKTGAEAVSAAVRLARNFTGRDKIISCGYHGWHDGFLAKGAEPGVPRALRETIFDLPYGDLQHAHSLVERHGRELACIVVEPIIWELNRTFLKELERLAQSVGALLVFDEVITGFRVALGGVQELLGIEADLTTFGKALANGFPISAVVGRKEVFDAAEDLWISSTFGGEALSLAAALATITELERPHVLQRMWRLGESLRDGWKGQLECRPEIEAEAVGVGPLPVLRFRPEARAQEDLFIREMLDRGFVTRRNNYWFITASHTTVEIAEALEATDASFQRIQQSAIGPRSGR